MKIYQETYGNFFGIFCKNFGMHMGSISKNAGAINNKNQRNTRKRKKAPGPYIHSPNPRILMGPDHPNAPEALD